MFFVHQVLVVLVEISRETGIFTLDWRGFSLIIFTTVRGSLVSSFVRLASAFASSLWSSRELYAFFTMYLATRANWFLQRRKHFIANTKPKDLPQTHDI